MKKNFDYFGVMIDCSRNAVMSVDSLKKLLPILKKMGYNCLMLYTEETYEVDGEPYFGYLRGRYTKEEMKEIDTFANSLGMETIPCIQTLAHLHSLFRWKTVPVDIDDILMTDDERTYQLIENMFKTLSECFKSRKIHIGMDEAQNLGRGTHLDRFGYENANLIIKRHLDKIIEIAQKYNYELLMWSDMFFRPWNNHSYYIDEVKEVPAEVIDSLDESVIPVYWDYYHGEKKSYDIMLSMHRQLSDKTWFAGGLWSWGGFMPHNAFSIAKTLEALRSCRENGIRNVILTLWGDCGGECSHFAQLPAFYAAAEFAKGNEDMELIKTGFEKKFGLSYDDFMMLDAPNDIVSEEEAQIISNSFNPINPCKYMLYSDCFNGFIDYTVSKGVGKIYGEHAAKLNEIAKKAGKYRYLFTTAAALCSVLEIKYELGVITREAYRSNDKELLLRLATEDYPEVKKRIERFASVYEKQWFKENKTTGFDVQDLRLGGLIRRIDACRRRLNDYLNGKIDSIEELEIEILPFREAGKPTYINDFKFISTANVF